MKRPTSINFGDALCRSKKRAPIGTRPLRLEMLEDRLTPDATITFVDNVIDVVGTDSRDVITFTAPRADKIKVTVTTGEVIVQKKIVGVDKDTRIEVFGGAGNDRIDNQTWIPMRAFRASGNDKIFGGSGDDEIYGNEGDDLIHGRGGNDLLSGNEGSDRIYGDKGHDEIHGDNGSHLLTTTAPSSARASRLALWRKGHRRNLWQWRRRYHHRRRWK